MSNRKSMNEQPSRNNDDTFSVKSKSPELRSLMNTPMNNNYRSIANTPISPVTIDYDSASIAQFNTRAEIFNKLTDCFDLTKKLSHSIADSFNNSQSVIYYVKISILLVYSLLCFSIFSLTKEKNLVFNQLILTDGLEFTCDTSAYRNLTSPYLKVVIYGSFLKLDDASKDDLKNGDLIQINLFNYNDSSTVLSSLSLLFKNRTHLSTKLDNTFELDNIMNLNDTFFKAALNQRSLKIPLAFACTQLSTHYKHSTLYSGILVILTYGVIILEILHRAIAAGLGSLGGLALIALINNERPTLDEVVTWIEWETILLMFGMMVIVAVFFETGFFDLIAVRIFHYSADHLWAMIFSLCFLSSLLSAFLDNVTTILLLTPITIRLCEVMNLSPRNIIIAQVIFSNIGGASTAIGDPPNVLLTANEEIASRGINFTNFTAHMLTGSVFVFIVAFLHLKFLLADASNFVQEELSDLDEMRKEVKIWKRSYLSITPLTKEEKLVRTLLKEKYSQLENLLAQKVNENKREHSNTLKLKSMDLFQSVKITNFALLIKAGLVFLFAVCLFFLHPFLDRVYLSIGWISLFSALVLLVISSSEKNGIDFEAVMHKIEWPSLLFFVGLFVFMKCVDKLGLLNYLAEEISTWINSVSGESDRLAIALVIMVLVSAIVSSLIDNIPFTTAMIPIVLQLSKKSQLPIKPLVYALAFGSCLGGNGTLIGASCNLVAAAISEQHGHKISFFQFSRIGFPIMLSSVLTALIYENIVCIYLKWY